MKKTTLAFIALITSIATFAQKVQFSNSSNRWSLIDSNVGCCIPVTTAYTTAYYDSNTINYNGHTYQQLITSIGSVMTREVSGKVYIINTTDSAERLLYDFNMAVGDTTFTFYPEDKYIAWVTTIDSTQFGGQWYKVWHFEGRDSVLYYTDSVRPISYNVIEGIGCTNGLYYPVNAYNRATFSQQLMCFENDMHITSGLSAPVIAYGDGYFSLFDNNTSCTEFYSDHSHGLINAVGVGTVANEQGAVKVYPNPVNGSSKVALPYLLASGDLIITNAMGQVVARYAIENKAEIAIGAEIKVPGMYYFKVKDKQSGTVFSGKFVY